MLQSRRPQTSKPPRAQGAALLRKGLVASSGEVAVRVLLARRALGVASGGVHSETDRGALHVRLAGEAVELGPAPAAESHPAAQRVAWAGLGPTTHVLKPKEEHGRAHGSR